MDITILTAVTLAGILVESYISERARQQHQRQTTTSDSQLRHESGRSATREVGIGYFDIDRLTRR